MDEVVASLLSRRFDLPRESWLYLFYSARWYQSRGCDGVGRRNGGSSVGPDARREARRLRPLRRGFFSDFVMLSTSKAAPPQVRL
jgi:hypothetical protein